MTCDGAFSDDPLRWFEHELSRAKEREVFDPTRAALATVDSTLQPSVRFVLVKQVDERGFAFFTNLNSAKARARASTARGAGVSLVEHRRSDPGGRQRRTAQRERERRVFRDAPSRQPARSLGIQPKRGYRHARAPGAAARTRDRAFSRQYACAKATALGRSAREACTHRDLARWRGPHARPLVVHARRERVVDVRAFAALALAPFA